MTVCFLSIIIPAFNEEQRLPAALNRVLSYLNHRPFDFEIIVVENGSHDRTYELARVCADQHPEVRVLQETKRGKGLAVRTGMLEARGEYRFMCDVDFSMPVEEIERFFPPQLTGCDVAIASRETAGAVRYNEPFHRHAVGRIFNQLIRWMALPDFHDTQCGFKCFHAPAARQIFQCVTIGGWTFDVEALYIARKFRYKIVEVPVPWYFNPDSKVHVLRDSWQMALDLYHIRRNSSQGKYDNCYEEMPE